MSQLYEKCDCKQYEASDHRAALIKMDLPDYEDSQYGGNQYIILRTIRFVGYITVLVLLGYSLWRIHVIETSLGASDRLANVSHILAAVENQHHLHRTRRSVGNHIDHNGLALGEKDMAKGTMLTAKNENAPPAKKRSKNKEEFEELVNSLFDKIQMMHNDTDRGHFDQNMKAVFQAWFPVFDALLPQELMDNAPIRETRSTKSSEETSGEKNINNAEFIRKDQKEDSDESSEEKTIQKRSIDDDSSSQSVDSSEEEKKRIKYNKNTNLKDNQSDESSESKSIEKVGMELAYNVVTSEVDGIKTVVVSNLD